MAYEAECRTIIDAIEEVGSLLEELGSEGLIDNSYGDRIRTAEIKLSNAADEANYIDDQSDENDVDLGEVHESAEEIDNLVQEVENKVEEIKQMASEIRTSVRDYA
jgi:hypothetical protein